MGLLVPENDWPAFAKALHNCFKDGLNDTRDYRALAGLLILLGIAEGSIHHLYLICGQGLQR